MRVLFVVSEKGYTWEEVIEPWRALVAANIEVVMASPTGSPPSPDPNGIKVRPLLSFLGYGVSKKASPESEPGRRLSNVLATPISLSAAEELEFDGVYLAGGHGALFDLHNNEALQRILLKMDAAQKPIGALCHASSILAKVQKDGTSLIADRTITGFPTLLEHFILLVGWVHERFLPLPLWTGRELNRHSKKRSVWLKLKELLDMKTVIRDGHILTGVGPKAAFKLGGQLVEMLEDKRARQTTGQ